MKCLAMLILLAIQEPDVDALLKQLSDETLQVREKAAAALIELGARAEEKLKSRLATAEGEFKSRLEAVLRGMEKARKLKSVYPPLRRVSLDVKAAPVRDVLERLRKESGLSIDATLADESTVTVSVKDVFPLEALDAVCRAADLEFLPDPRRHGMGRRSSPAETIVLNRGYTGVPRSFAGPFVVSADTLSLSRTQGLGKEGHLSSSMQVSLSIYWPPGCRPSKLADYDMTSAKDDQGTDLLPDAGLHGRRDALIGDLQRPLTVLLKGPAAGANHITLKGKGALLFSLDQTVVAFKPPGECEGQERNTDLLAIRLESCVLEKDTARFKVKVTQKGGGGPAAGIHQSYLSPENIRLVTTDGQKQRNVSWTASGLGKGHMDVELTYRNLTAPVASLEFTFDTEEHRVDFNFELIG
jgi:hypothetical protein